MPLPSRKPSVPGRQSVKSGVTIDPTATEITGTVSKPKHHGNGDWRIFEVNGGIICCGVVHEFFNGMKLRLYDGHFEKNPRYNNEWNFHFKKYESLVDPCEGMKHYLMAECPYLGESKADDLARKFGLDSVKKCAEDPQDEFIQMLIGRNSIRMKELREWARQDLRLSDMKAKLYQLGLTTHVVKKILDHCGRDAEAAIRHDCFSLTQIKGIGFKTVSAIAIAIGLPEDDPGRIKAGIIETIRELESEGDTCSKRDYLVEKTQELLGIPHVKIQTMIDVMIESKLLITNEQKFKAYVDQMGIVL